MILAPIGVMNETELWMMMRVEALLHRNTNIAKLCYVTIIGSEQTAKHNHKMR